MTLAVVPLTMGTVEMLPAECRRCVAWELDPAGARAALLSGDTEFEKEVWLSGVMLTWGSAGQVVTVDDEPVGFALYAPPTAVPGGMTFPTSPVSPDAVLLTTARIRADHTGRGLARFLMNAVVRELTRRGVRAIELFARETPAGPENAGRTRDLEDPGAAVVDAGVPDRATSDAVDQEVPQCLVPAGFARAVGFTVVAPHPRYPRLRFELEKDLGWKAEVEAALEKLFTTITVPASPSPVRELAGATAHGSEGATISDPPGARPRPDAPTAAVSEPPRCGSSARGPAGPRS